MIDLTKFSALAETERQEASERAMHARWIDACTRIGAENTTRREKYEADLAEFGRAVAAGSLPADALPPERPVLLAAPPALFELEERRRLWRDRRKAALVAHADDIEHAIDIELLAIAKKAAPHRAELQKLDEQAGQLGAQRHELDIALREVGKLPPLDATHRPWALLPTDS